MSRQSLDELLLLAFKNEAPLTPTLECLGTRRVLAIHDGSDSVTEDERNHVRKCHYCQWRVGIAARYGNMPDPLEAMEGQKRPTWDDVLRQSRELRMLPLPTAEEAVCLSAIAGFDRDDKANPVSVLTLLAEVKKRQPNWSLIRLRDVADKAVAKGFLQPQKCRFENGDPSVANVLRTSPGDPGTVPESSLTYQLAQTPEELVGCIAIALAKTGKVTAEDKSCLLDLCADLQVEPSLVDQIRSWLMVL